MHHQNLGSNIISLGCNSPGKLLDGSYEEPNGGAGDCSLKVLGKAVVSIEPCKGTFDDPTPGYDFEAFSRV